jgi:hypothetical protein
MPLILARARARVERVNNDAQSAHVTYKLFFT